MPNLQGLLRQVSDRMTVAEQRVIDDEDYGFETEALESSCAHCVFDCPYNPRSKTNRDPSFVTWSTADASDTSATG